MFYPIPFEYHDLIVDRRDPRPLRFTDDLDARRSRLRRRRR
jgi:hypothetical protein